MPKHYKYIENEEEENGKLSSNKIDLFCNFTYMSKVSAKYVEFETFPFIYDVTHLYAVLISCVYDFIHRNT